MKAAQEGAAILAERLRKHAEVGEVHWPGFDTTGIAKKQMFGPGSVLAFEPKGGFEAAKALMAAVKIMAPAVSLGSTDTLIQHPAGLTHRVVSEEGKKQGHIGAGLIRLSVGLEHPEDLWADLSQALVAAEQAAAAAV